ncbi:MAG: rRNA maturation RNase YbeY [Sphingobacteriaceae bacterium]|nr:rRNA maturation RNase YbeY [Sphingobacteriaceae bacterium]
MAKINFFNQDDNYVLKHKLKIKKWLQNTISEHQFSLLELNFIFCSDDGLLEINKKHLNHDYYTDVITFDNSDEENILLGDIFISIDRVKENAKLYEISTTAELHRIMIHGTLHLLGFKDKNKADKALMTEMENKYLAVLGQLD